MGLVVVLVGEWDCHQCTGVEGVRKKGMKLPRALCRTILFYSILYRHV